MKVYVITDLISKKVILISSDVTCLLNIDSILKKYTKIYISSFDISDKQLYELFDILPF